MPINDRTGTKIHRSRCGSKRWSTSESVECCESLRARLSEKQLVSKIGEAYSYVQKARENSRYIVVVLIVCSAIMNKPKRLQTLWSNTKDHTTCSISFFLILITLIAFPTFFRGGKLGWELLLSLVRLFRSGQSGMQVGCCFFVLPFFLFSFFFSFLLFFLSSSSFLSFFLFSFFLSLSFLLHYSSITILSPFRSFPSSLFRLSYR